MYAKTLLFVQNHQFPLQGHLSELAVYNGDQDTLLMQFVCMTIRHTL